MSCTEYEETPVDVVIDSVDTLLSNFGSQSRTYNVLSATLSVAKHSPSMFLVMIARFATN